PERSTSRQKILAHPGTEVNMKRHRSFFSCPSAWCKGKRGRRRGVEGTSAASRAGTAELGDRRDRGLEPGSIDRAPDAYRVGIGQLDLELEVRSRIEDRHRDEARGHGAGTLAADSIGCRLLEWRRR